MCTSIVETAAVRGSAKRGDRWFGVSRAVASYDHPTHLQLEDAILLDFVDPGAGPGARAAVELSLASAKALRDALDRAIAAAEEEEADARPARLLAAE